MEIILLIIISLHISKIAERKGQSQIKWVLIVGGYYILGELVLATMALYVFGMANLLPIAISALIGGLIGFVFGRALLLRLPDPEEEDDEPKEETKPDLSYFR